MKVYAVFDIGKTNKKFFLFDHNFQEVYKDYVRFEPSTDDDGDPCEDLSAIESWMWDTLKRVLQDSRFEIDFLNFSSYGASFVHVGVDGKPVAPLYNYLKTIPSNLLDGFSESHGDISKICRETASPSLGFLNSGMQLFWIKRYKPELFDKIQWSLHLPQYLSYLFTGKLVSEYTSIGCHTFLWDFEKNDYHRWVYQEALTDKFPAIVNSDFIVEKEILGKTLNIGIGIHDSSSALLPYIRADRKPFVLVSTGTWSITLNGFSEDTLSEQDLDNDCLNYMGVNGNPVRACRLFLGHEYRQQVKHLHDHYHKEYGYHREVGFNHEIYQRLITDYRHYFRFESISTPRQQPNKTSVEAFEDFQTALHQLVLELVELQVDCIKRAIGSTRINKVYIDGGFADNPLFVQMISTNFPEYKLRTTQSPLGSALGAAIISSQPELNKKFLKKKYAMKKLAHPSRPTS